MFLAGKPSTTSASSSAFRSSSTDFSASSELSSFDFLQMIFLLLFFLKLPFCLVQFFVSSEEVALSPFSSHKFRQSILWKSWENGFGPPCCPSFWINVSGLPFLQLKKKKKDSKMQMFSLKAANKDYNFCKCPKLG